MTDFVYNYTIDQFPNEKYDLSKLDREIRDSSITVSLNYLSGFETNVDIFFRAELDDKEWTTLSGVVAAHDGEDDYIDYTPIKIMAVDSTVEQKVSLNEENRDRSNKLRVHQTSRKLGLRIMWTGIGDDTSDPDKVGDGETLTFNHNIGDEEPMVKYIDFNIAGNETWIHEGYMTWENAKLDTLTLQMVPRTVTVSGVTGGDKTVYGGYLVVPTPPGYGNVEIVNDLTDPIGGLVYMPNNDLDESPTAYWDADWNSSTGKYENIVPNYTGTGRYNIFSYEIIFAEFIRQVPFLGSGFIALTSSDTDQLGQGMRLKMIADTNNTVDDHDWAVACIMCLHRDHSV
jgi:hypothetical protein